MEHTYDRLLTEMLSLQAGKMQEEAALSKSAFSSAEIQILCFAILAIIVSVVTASFIIRNLMQQLGGEPEYAAGIARKIADGDLAVAINLRANDQTSLLNAMKVMRDNLATIVNDVRSGADIVVTASSQIASGNLDLSSRTEMQASSLEETASSMEEMTATVKQNADNASQANQLAISASDVAREGGAIVSEVVATMDLINASSKKIVDIISVIDGIAFQTNILALNAAVEAARAGEQGRGFAVVASEVRNLAQRSSAAAKEIKDLIGNSVEQADVGTALVAKAGATMQAIVESVNKVTDIMGEITMASQEQNSGIEQINQAVTQMDETTQQNAALVEEAAAAAGSLQEQASNLSKVVSVFNLSATPTATVAPLSAARRSRAVVITTQSRGALASHR
ncbi:methyl-accepting chemotaxis protein [Pseudoduganella sp. CY13W]|uniref:Methyl-accepting chemotaxis protein n=2 Tax=Duganella qianjiadongensis TaxID=2692176 RepID=A0ABW9VKC3_9BURK|nr:methyl-accepting chemotaxis protein [Duganella qianjiadongensis]